MTEAVRKRQMGQHALAAKQIRAELKRHGIKGRVRSKSYSMGSSVDIDVEDLQPATVERLREFCGQYQYGHFDGMTDCYEYSNRRDLPQAKYVIVSARYSESMRDAAWKYLQGYLAGVSDGPNPVTVDDEDQLWRVLTGKLGNFWTDRKPRVSTQPVRSPWAVVSLGRDAG